MQVFVGRVAMIGFAAAIVGEIQTGGKGPLGQLALPIHTPVNPGLAGGCLCKRVLPRLTLMLPPSSPTPSPLYIGLAKGKLRLTMSFLWNHA